MIKRYLPYLLTPFFLILAFPPFNLYPLAFIAFIPIFFILEKEKSFLKLFLSGIIFNLLLLYWLFPVLTGYGGMPWYFAVLSLILLFGYLSLYLSVPLFFFKNELIFIFPFFYVFFEIVLEHFLTGFPWGILANSQASNTGLSYFFYTLGVRGVSLFVLFSNIIIYKAIKSKNMKAPWIVISLLIVLNIPGFFIKVKKEKEVKVAAVQGNEKMKTVWTGEIVLNEFEKYMRYTRKAVNKGAKIIVWPEFCFPYYPKYQSSFTDKLKEFTKINDIILVLGANDLNSGNYYNTAFIFYKGKMDYYYKVHLTPFGEYIPYKKIFFFANKIANVEGEFTKGKDVKVFDIDGLKIGIPICYEMVFPSLIKKFYDKGVNLLVTITNDSWFGKTSGPVQHFYISKIRAMEMSLPVLRAATSGISGVFESNGKILKKLGYGREGLIISKVYVKEKSFSIFYSIYYLLRYLILFGFLLYIILYYFIFKK